MRTPYIFVKCLRHSDSSFYGAEKDAVDGAFILYYLPLFATKTDIASGIDTAP